MPKRLTQEDAIEKFNKRHSGKYGYSKVDYKNSHTLIDVECPKHGYFKILPYHHWNGVGCDKCKADIHRKPNYGIGINDVYGESGWHPIYRMWSGIIRRCFDEKFKEKQPTYADCSIHPEWIYYSKFKEWVLLPENKYHDGLVIDKDILVKGNKLYSPDTCCLVPQRINTLILKCDKYRGDLPIGVSRNNKRFSATLNRKHLGTYDTPIEAFNVYKEAKENLIKDIAKEYYDKGEITMNVYEALMKYQIEITD